MQSSRSTKCTSALEKDLRDPVVCVVDHDELMRIRLKELFEAVGLKILPFDSPAAFLQSDMGSCSCVVLDVRLPDMSGLKLQEELLKREIRVPMVFVSESGDAATAVRAMKSGAVDFLTKPAADHDVLDAVFAALDCDRERRRKEISLAALRADFNSLSARERQVLLSVAHGKLNKQVAADLGVSEVIRHAKNACGVSSEVSQSDRPTWCGTGRYPSSRQQVCCSSAQGSYQGSRLRRVV